MIIPGIANDPDDIGMGAAFVDVEAGACQQAILPDFGMIDRRQHDNTGRGTGGEDGFQGGYAVHDGHFDVAQGNIGFESVVEFDAFPTIFGFTDDGKPRFFHELPEHHTNSEIVIYK